MWYGEEEVAWKMGKVLVVMTMKPSLNQCHVLWKHFVFETMRAFMYVHITERNQANIIYVERLLSSLKKKSASKQMRINDVFKEK
jgi:hypothetical protein